MQTNSGTTGGSGRARRGDGRARELSILNAIAEALNSSADVRPALERTLALVADLLGLRFHASIPLSFHDRPLGIVNVAGPSWLRLTQDELRLLATIAYQVGIAVERARLAEASGRLARAEERTRIAREIHDTLAQGLTAIGLDLEGALRHLESDPARSRERLERALGMARTSLEEARRSVLDLRAAPLAGRPLAEALAALGRAFTSETGVRVHVAASGDVQLPLRSESELYRIAQEALANVRQHAHATEVEIALRARAGEVILSVKDDGIGFDTRRSADGRHGLVGMRERARLLGGALRVVAHPGRGTTVSARVPLAPSEDPA